jgi:CheY-like chemotaxis protein
MDIAKLKVLVIEDHEFQRRELIRMLQDLGATKLNGAKNGRDALDIIRSSSEPFDIIVSDLNMPGMDGMEFIRHLGDRKSTRLNSSH